jgi:hypothetical protein
VDAFPGTEIQVAIVLPARAVVCIFRCFQPIRIYLLPVLITLFLRKVLAVVAPVAILVSSVNYVVDPANIYSPDAYVSGIAEILSGGHNVDNISNYDERKLQEQMVSRLNSTPDIMVLGSSRIMEVGEAMLPGHRVLNCGVSHAQIRDIIAMVGLLDSLHHLPDSILLNVDAGLVSEGATSEWESLSPYYQSYLQHHTGELWEGAHEGIRIPRKINSLFSLDYFQSSIQFMARHRTRAYSDVGTAEPSHYGRHHDGTVAYAKDYREGSPEKVEDDARTAIRNIGVGKPVDDMKRLFELLLKDLKARHVSVTLCLLPYHPVFYQAFQPLISSYEAYYQRIAIENRMDIRGSMDPGKAGVSGKDFYDAFHVRKNSVGAILNL